MFATCTEGTNGRRSPENTGERILGGRAWRMGSRARAEGLALKRHKALTSEAGGLGVGRRDNRGMLLHFTLHSNLESKGSAPFFQMGTELRGEVKYPRLHSWQVAGWDLNPGVWRNQPMLLPSHYMDCHSA